MNFDFDAGRRWWLATGLAAGLGGCASATPSRSDEASPEDWQAFRLPGKRETDYRRGRKEGVACWHARADRSASMWRRQVNVQPDQLGEVQFSWWVPHGIDGADVSQADTEDAPARVIFAFDGDESRLTTRHRMLYEMARALTGEAPPFATLMYVWADHAPPETLITNPRLDRIRKIVVESGDAHLRQWRHYRRDLVADFRRAFGEPPGPLRGIALMTDADNTGSRAEAWYGDVRVQGLPPG